MQYMGPYFMGAVFWIFIAAVSVTAIITDYKRRRGIVELLRTAIQEGEQLDPALIEKLTYGGEHGQRVEPVQLKLGGIITLASGVGICLLSFFLWQVAPIALYPTLGVGVVAICVGVGLLIGSKTLAEAHAREQPRKSQP